MRQHYKATMSVYCEKAVPILILPDKYCAIAPSQKAGDSRQEMVTHASQKQFGYFANVLRI